MTAEERSINVTLIFSLSRYRQVIDAYLSGLEEYARGGGDVMTVRSVASFFVSRVDSEVERRLQTIGTPEALVLRDHAAVAQAQLAYQLFGDQFVDTRWTELAAHDAHVQRPLWASTSTKSPNYPDHLYVDNLIGPDTVSTLPQTTSTAFEDHGSMARTIHRGAEDPAAVLDQLAHVGVEMDDVGLTLEDQGVASFHESLAHVFDTLTTKAHQLARS